MRYALEGRWWKFFHKPNHCPGELSPFPKPNRVWSPGGFISKNVRKLPNQIGSPPDLPDTLTHPVRLGIGIGKQIYLPSLRWWDGRWVSGKSHSNAFKNSSVKSFRGGKETNSSSGAFRNSSVTVVDARRNWSLVWKAVTFSSSIAVLSYCESKNNTNNMLWWPFKLWPHNEWYGRMNNYTGMKNPCAKYCIFYSIAWASPFQYPPIIIKSQLQ